jgi:hypothetical protein
MNRRVEIDMRRFLLGITTGILFSRLVYRCPEPRKPAPPPPPPPIETEVNPSSDIWRKALRAILSPEYLIWLQIEFFGALLPIFLLYVALATQASGPLSLTEFGGKGEFILIASGLLFAQVAKAMGMRNNPFRPTAQFLVAIVLLMALLSAMVAVQLSVAPPSVAHALEERAVLIGVVLLLATVIVAAMISVLKATGERR